MVLALETRERVAFAVALLGSHYIVMTYFGRTTRRARRRRAPKGQHLGVILKE